MEGTQFLQFLGKRYSLPSGHFKGVEYHPRAAGDHLQKANLLETEGNPAENWGEKWLMPSCEHLDPGSLQPVFAQVGQEINFA